MSTKKLFDYVTPRSFLFWRKVCESEDCLLLVTLSAAILTVLMATLLFETNTELTTWQTTLVVIGMVVETVSGIVTICGFVQLFCRKNDEQP